MKSFETLITKNGFDRYDDRWSPRGAKTYEEYFSQGEFSDTDKKLRKNIVYSLQYLEYLQLQLSELTLHNIVQQQVYKSYIITSMGIIEGVFYYLIKKNNLLKNDRWSLVGKSVHTNKFKDEDGKFKKHLITTMVELDTPEERKMDFEAMINKVQSKKLLSIKNEIFPFIKALKRLRNKVHLHIAKDDMDTDYWKIRKEHYLFSRWLLFSIITDEKLDTYNKRILHFIKLSDEELSYMKKRKNELKK